jgi:conjugal transfer pilus assembly protein TraB
VKLIHLNLQQKQRLRVVGVIAGILAIALVLTLVLQGNKGRKNGAPPKEKMVLLKDRVGKETWAPADSSKIALLETEVQRLKADLEATRKAQKEQEAKEIMSKSSKPAENILKTPLPSPGIGRDAPPVPPVARNPPARPESRPEIDKEKARDNDPKRIKDSSSVIRVFTDERSKEKEKASQRKDEKQSKGKGVYIPAGGLMKATLLSGIDAPTKGTAQGEPYPVLMAVTDLTLLPNRYRADLRECFVIGAGYGVLSDERAYIRMETLSCVRKDGQVIDVGLKGHVVGEDGKLGMQGRLVSKQGQQIAMAVLAGTLSSFGQALRPANRITLDLSGSTIDQGAMPFGEGLLEAGGQGIGTAMNRVAEYYLKRADEMYPIIEIDAGREIEIIILKGQELKI